MSKTVGGLLSLVLLLWAAAAGAQASAGSPNASAATAWRLLDYIAVDYSAAVSAGKILSQAEYDEMVEFSRSVEEQVTELPSSAAKPELERQGRELRRAIGLRAPPARVADLARALGRDLLRAYPVTLAPSAAPDLARGAALYQQQCAACHGVAGRADGPAASGLEPAPIDFTDKERADQRSLFGLYQVINQGLEGTAMGSFAHLSAADQWALAFYVGGFAYSQEDAQRGARLWRNDSAIRQRFPDLEAATQATPEALRAAIGEQQARAITAFLRRSPGDALGRATPPLEIARVQLRQSLEAYLRGDRRLASSQALAAYLDGFEPVEPVLSVRNPSILAQVERAMGEYRAALAAGVPPAEVERRAERLQGLFDEAERLVAERSSSWTSSFLAATTILLREGLEALLIVVAMVAFLRKADRTEVLRYVHGGWIAALLAGGVTWFVATQLISISGASREFTEGFGSLFAAAVLISVGIWMHGKAQAGAWQHYVKQKLHNALSRRSAWFLFLLVFVVVYREVFETILFMTALWAEGNATGMIGGSVMAAALLVVIAVALLRYSRSLPIAQFFSLSSLLIAGLAVVLAGKGVAGLQEAGALAVQPVAGAPRSEVLGLYPTREGLLAQAATLAVLVLGFWYSSQRAKRSAAARLAS